MRATLHRAAPDPWCQLSRGIEALGVEVGTGFEAGAQLFLAELARWSRVARLTGHRSGPERVRELVLGSLTFLAAIPEPAAPLLDVGSGAGIPGIVLKLARPAWLVTLIEANRRRVHFLRQVARRLAQAGLEVREGRAEALAGDPGLAAAFRTVTMRAVVGPVEAARLARPFLAPGGHAVIAARPDAAAPPGGTVRRVAVTREDLGLRINRTFLIIPAGVMAPGGGGPADVPRETPGGAWPAS